MNDYSLKALLNNLPKERLLRIARAHDLAVGNERKLEVISLLLPRLSEPRYVRQALAQLPPASQTVYLRVQEAGGRAFSRGLLSGLEHDGLLRNGARGKARHQPSTDQSGNGPPTVEEALGPLLDSGLLFSAAGRWLAPTAENLTRYNTELLIAREVLGATHEATPPLAHVTDTLLQICDASAQDFQRDVYLYWNYVRAQSVTLTAAGLVPKRHLVRINDALIVKEDLQVARDEAQAARLHFIRLMMEATGLIRRVERRLEPIPGAVEFFGYTLARRTDRFFQTWKRSPEWNELLRLPIRPRQQEQRSSRATQLVVRARQYVLSLIEEYSAEGWLSLADLVKKVRVGHYEFLFKRTREEFGAVNPYYYFHNPLGWGFPVGDESEGWDKVESEFIRSIVREPLYWLGLTSLGHEQGELTAFRLTPLGAHVFGLSVHAPNDDTVAANGRVVVQPNFQIFALEPISEQVLAVLDRFADRIKTDKAYEYHLTRESIYRAQQNGMRVPEVIAFLTQTGASALPQNVQRTLEEWSEGFERIVIRRNVSLLHALDADVLDRLQADPAAESFLLSRPLPRVLITRSSPAAQEAVAGRLRARGELAAASTRDVHDALVLDEEGKVTLLHPLPNIFLLQALARHAERRGDVHYLSEAVVKAERSAGATTEQIIARWERWHHGPLPQALLTRVKRWGRFFGAAHIPAMRRIQLPGGDVVDELLLDPEVGPYLRRYAADPSSVFVCDEDLEHVRAMLVARGIAVQ